MPKQPESSRRSAQPAAGAERGKAPPGTSGRNVRQLSVELSNVRPASIRQKSVELSNVRPADRGPADREKGSAQ
jgi:hypothetical protein